MDQVGRHLPKAMISLRQAMLPYRVISSPFNLC